MVGDGDGSRICVEGLNSPQVKLPEGFHITWIGNSLQTAEEYIASRDGDRYIHKIVPFYQRGMIKGIPGHVQSWELRPDSKMHLTTTDKTTGKSFETVGDMVIDATGYQDTVSQILSSAGAQAKTADITGPLPELNLTTTLLGRQALAENGEALPIFMIGAAASALATREELAGSPNKNPIAIFNTVARTSMLMSQLTNTKPASSSRGLRPGRPPVQPAAKLIENAQKHRRQQINRPLSLNVERKLLLRMVS
ncbi:MAG TPA: hypothetical protein VIG33_05630, partial [Pseudobdellovibrionaceae bacterium]|jgi:hypothetical protein